MIVVTPLTGSGSTDTPRTGSRYSSSVARDKHALTSDAISKPVVPLSAPRPAGTGRLKLKAPPRRTTFTPDAGDLRVQAGHLQEVDPQHMRIREKDDPVEGRLITVHPLVKALLERRLRLGASRSEVRNWSGLNEKTLYAIEVGLTTNLRIDTLDAYAHALGVEIEFYLLPRREPKDG